MTTISLDLSFAHQIIEEKIRGGVHLVPRVLGYGRSSSIGLDVGRIVFRMLYAENFRVLLVYSETYASENMKNEKLNVR